MELTITNTRSVVSHDVTVSLAASATESAGLTKVVVVVVVMSVDVVYSLLDPRVRLSEAKG